MLNRIPQRGDSYNIAQSAALYRIEDDGGLVFVEFAIKPILALFIELERGEDFAKVIVGDKVRCVGIENLREIRGDI